MLLVEDWLWTGNWIWTWLLFLLLLLLFLLLLLLLVVLLILEAVSDLNILAISGFTVELLLFPCSLLLVTDNNKELIVWFATDSFDSLVFLIEFPFNFSFNLISFDFVPFGLTWLSLLFLLEFIFSIDKIACEPSLLTTKFSLGILVVTEADSCDSFNFSRSCIDPSLEWDKLPLTLFVVLTGNSTEEEDFDDTFNMFIKSVLLLLLLLLLLLFPFSLYCFVNGIFGIEFGLFMFNFILLKLSDWCGNFKPCFWGL